MRKSIRELVKDVVLLALAVPTVILFLVLLLGHTVMEPNKAIVGGELSLSILILIFCIYSTYHDIRRW